MGEGQRMHRLHPGMAALALMLLTSAPALAVDEPQGYRSAPYRAPVPATLAGAPALSIAQAAEFHAAGAVFVDVLPHERRPEGLPEGTIWRSPPHRRWGTADFVRCGGGAAGGCAGCPNAAETEKGDKIKNADLKHCTGGAEDPAERGEYCPHLRGNRRTAASGGADGVYHR